MKLRQTRFTTTHPEGAGPEAGFYLDPDYDRTRDILQALADRAKDAAAPRGLGYTGRQPPPHLLRRELRAIWRALVRVLIYELPGRS